MFEQQNEKILKFLLQGEDVTAFLLGQLECKEKELFVVVTSEVEQNQRWQSSPHDQKHLNGSSVEEPVTQICLETLLPDFNTRIIPNQNNKANSDRTGPADENEDSVTQHLICNISNERTINSPLLESNR
jgi:hypothetical protein